MRKIVFDDGIEKDIKMSDQENKFYLAERLVQLKDAIAFFEDKRDYLSYDKEYSLEDYGIIHQDGVGIDFIKVDVSEAKTFNVAVARGQRRDSGIIEDSIGLKEFSMENIETFK